jgi:hypothetical protein
MARPQAASDENVPIFGTWPRMYAAVLVCEAVTVGLIAVFSLWRW